MKKHSPKISTCFLNVLLLLLFALLFSFSSFAEDKNSIPEEKSYEGKVMKVLEEDKNVNGGYYQKLEIEVLNEDLRGSFYTVENGTNDTPTSQRYKKGDILVLAGYKDEAGNVNLFVSDYVRRGSLLSLFLIFLIVSVAIAGKRGFTSLLGMAVTFFAIFSIVLPKISSGSSAVLIILVFSIISIPINFYLSHGFNKKTTVAIVGTFISLVFTIILSAFYVNSAKLTGFTSDEASFLQLVQGGSFNMRGILLAGIIVGVLGVLDDITVSQSAIVFQLKNANRRLAFSELFSRSMDVGKDHIASMINTLILVYAGASLPLLLLFINSTKSFNEVVNYEIISSEIIRTLLGSIGLIIAVPITTLVACAVAGFDEERENK